MRTHAKLEQREVDRGKARGYLDAGHTRSFRRNRMSIIGVDTSEKRQLPIRSGRIHTCFASISGASRCLAGCILKQQIDIFAAAQR